MCYEFEREYLLRRADEARNEMKKAEERMRQAKPVAPAAPTVPARGAEQPEPVPV